ncbi:MAG: hypothetical protein HGA96_01760 [Desulfobulbaceae bacterium]|nr:hypothetical protein [Desulfobulbaceae bacterium]
MFYLALALLYVGLLSFWGRHDVGRLSREYRQATVRLRDGYAQERAEREVAAGCRQAVGGESAPGYGDCLRASTSLVQKRAAVLSGELLRERRQVVKKLVLFAALVGVGLIILPLALLYGFMVFLLYLLSNIRFAKESATRK